MPDDLTENLSSAQAGDDDRKDSKSTQEVDYKAKYNGMNRKFSKLQEEYDKLQEQYEEALTKVDEERSNARKGAKDLESQFKDLQGQFKQLQAEKEKSEADFFKLKLKDETRKLVKDKPALLDLLDEDLITIKPRSEFKDDDEYKAYIDKLSAKFESQAKTSTDTQPNNEEVDELAKQQQELFARQNRRVSGAVPAQTTTPQGGKGSTRTAQQIQDEMWNMDTADPKNREKYMQLESELNAILAKGR